MPEARTVEQVRDLVTRLHGGGGDRAVDAVLAEEGAPLEMDSLTIVMLVEALEDELGIRVAARDVVPENFASVAAIARYVERKRGVGGRP